MAVTVTQRVRRTALKVESESQVGGLFQSADPRLDAECYAHDADVARAGLDVWVGAEPTFTLRDSEAPEWLSEALGGDKYEFALGLVEALRKRHPGSLVLRTVGRQYDREPVPRWSVGLLERRDGDAVWNGPNDPLTGPVVPAKPEQLDDLWKKLHRRFTDLGWGSKPFSVPDPLDRRLLVRFSAAIGPICADDERLARPSVHRQETPRDGLSDSLADEGTRDAFRELELALHQLAYEPRPSAEFLYASLAPFLADTSGNVHRSELNIEKLWNLNLPGRGCLGLVEFRAFRMPCSPERAVAIAALLRAITAMLAGADPTPGLRDWVDALHDQYAFPFFLRQDLCRVFDDLAAHELELGERLRNELLHDPYKSRWQLVHAGCDLALEAAIEFWPLVGDVASQEAGGSRLVDSSTLRLQVSLRRVGHEGPALEDWKLQIAGYELPLRSARNDLGEVRLIGLRYRDFTPSRGLHPMIRPQGPLAFTLSHPALDEAVHATLHGWSPDGLPYSGLPGDLETAASRRAERLVIRRISRVDVSPAKPPPPEAVAGYTFDLRRVATRDH